MKVKTSFGHIAEAWDAKTGNTGVESVRENVKIITGMIEQPKGKLIYEIATGNGFLARKLYKAGATVYASDVAPELIKIAQTKYDSNGIKYSVREGSDCKGLPKRKFDAVIIHQGIFYIKDIDALTKGIASILKPGGMLIFTITHPLWFVMKASLSNEKASAKLSPIMKRGLKYRKNYTVLVHRKWEESKGKSIEYYTHMRPLSYYINSCAKHGLLVEQMVEPATRALRKGKLAKSPVPSVMVIKAIKI